MGYAKDEAIGFSYWCSKGALRLLSIWSTLETTTTIMFFGNALFKQNESVCAVRGSEVCPIIGTPHIPLSGHVKNGNAKQSFRTSVAEPYPPALCTKWAQLITDDYSTRKNGCLSNDRPVSSLVDAFHSCPSRSKASSPPPPSHYLTHFSKLTGCETCIRTKTVRKQHRRQQRDDPTTMTLPLPIKFGSIIVADHMKFNYQDEAVGCRNYALGIMDGHTGYTD